MQGQSDDRTSDIRTRHKAVWRYICHDIWLCIKLHCQRQCPVIFGARSCLCIRMATSFLNHNGNALYRHMALEKSHDDRCRNIIRKICHNLDRSALIVFIRKFRNVQFQDIFIDHGYIFRNLPASRRGSESGCGRSPLPTTFPAASARYRVIVPIPGPISSTQSSFVISAEAMILFSTWASIRKFCPNFF